jgi:tRNA pseudouridine38-40 synthase
MTKIRMLVAYDGTDFCGWQRQNHGPKKSVSQTMTEGLEAIFREKITLFASGRTDAGVHASGQVTHFETQKPVEAFTNWDLPWALRRYLPDSVSVKRAWLAPPEFHATLSATHKTYQYYVANFPRQPTFLLRYAGWVRHPLNLAHLQASSEYLVGNQDFKSFQSTGTPITNTVRKISQARWDQPRKNVFRFTVTGSGFLKQMVRNIVGTQLFLENKGLDPSEMRRILDAQDRKQAGPAAEPQGLFLRKVYYPQELDNGCRELYNGIPSQ